MATQEEIIRATQVEGVMTQPAEVREAAERITALTDEVRRMREVLRAAGSGEPIAFVPPDAGEYYGRVRAYEIEIRQLEERYGNETVAMAMAGDGPQNKQEPQSAAEVIAAGSLLEFAKTQRLAFQSETTRSIEFGVMLGSEEMLTLTLQRPDYSSPLEGARLDLEGGGGPQFISAPAAIELLSPQARRDWADNTTAFSIELAEKAAEVVDVAEMFAQVAAAPGTTFGVPEKLLAAYIEEQLRAGSEHINLTQSYLTEDPKAADARHTLALNQLLPLIEEAQKTGVTFESGEALLAAEKFREVIAVRPNQEEENRFSVML
jgi:hypothetical protein